MPRSKEISEDIRRKVVEAHKAGKGYKSISKELGLHRSTVRQIVHKWKEFSTVSTLPRSGRPAKINARVCRMIVKEVTKNPKATAKDLQASLACAEVYVHESTIRKTLNVSGGHGRAPQKKPLRSKKRDIAAHQKKQPLTKTQ